MPAAKHAAERRKLGPLLRLPALSRRAAAAAVAQQSFGLCGCLQVAAPVQLTTHCVVLPQTAVEHQGTQQQQGVQSHCGTHEAGADAPRCGSVARACAARRRRRPPHDWQAVVGRAVALGAGQGAGPRMVAPSNHHLRALGVGERSQAFGRARRASAGRAKVRASAAGGQKTARRSADTWLWSAAPGRASRRSPSARSWPTWARGKRGNAPGRSI